MSIAWADSAAWVLSGVLLAAAAAKTRDPAPFRVSVRAALPDGIVRRSRPIAGAVVLAEAIAGFALVVPAVRPPAAAGALLLFVGFGVVAVRSASGVAPVTCACFGATGSRLGWPHVVRSALLGLVAGSLLLPASQATVPGRVLPVTLTISVVVAVIAIFLDRLLGMLSVDAQGSHP